MKTVRRRKEDGAALVEMALVTPLLLILVLGIVEFGYVFGQYNEIRHATREGARYAAVSFPDLNGGGVDESDVLEAVCSSINLSNATVTVKLSPDNKPKRLEFAEITVTADISPLTNAPLISSFVPDTISNTASFRLEQDALWEGLNGNGAESTC